MPAAGKEVDVREEGRADAESDCACSAAAVGVELVIADGTVEVPLAEAVGGEDTAGTAAAAVDGTAECAVTASAVVAPCIEAGCESADRSGAAALSAEGVLAAGPAAYDVDLRNFVGSALDAGSALIAESVPSAGCALRA